MEVAGGHCLHPGGGPLQPVHCQETPLPRGGLPRIISCHVYEDLPPSSRVALVAQLVSTAIDCGFESYPRQLFVFPWKKLSCLLVIDPYICQFLLVICP